MKILRPGKVPKYKYTVECWMCDALLEFDEHDMRSERNEEYVVCPTCKSYIDVDGAKKEEI